MYLWGMCELLGRYFWDGFAGAPRLGYFNRNYAAHLAGKGRFYRPSNVIRLILLTDLLAEIVAAAHGKHALFSASDKVQAKRREFYMAELKFYEPRWEAYQAGMKSHSGYDD
jgi:hypothetical protein